MSRFKGLCDRNGCDLQSDRLGEKKFWGLGSGFAVDSTQPVTVTTQSITDDRTDIGKLAEEKQIYTPNSKTIACHCLRIQCTLSTATSTTPDPRTPIAVTMDLTASRACATGEKKFWGHGSGFANDVCTMDALRISSRVSTPSRRWVDGSKNRK